jgi:hypothetical protein
MPLARKLLEVYGTYASDHEPNAYNSFEKDDVYSQIQKVVMNLRKFSDPKTAHPQITKIYRGLPSNPSIEDIINLCSKELQCSKSKIRLILK